MPYLVPAIVNSMAILTYLKDPEHSGAGLSEIAGAVSIPTSTCLNLLRTLVHFGLLSFDANTKQYRLGWALFELGSRAADHLSHVEVLRPHLSALAKNLGLTCVLGREVGPRLMIIDKVEGSDDLRATTSVGQYHPMTSGAVGEGHTRLLERRGPTFPPRRARATPVHRNVNHRPRRIQTNAGRCSSSRVRRQLGGVLRRHQRRGFTGLRASQATTDGGGFARPGFCAHRGPHPGGGEARAPDRHKNDGCAGG